MKRFSILTPLLVMTLVLTACGAKAAATPTLSGVDIAGTAAGVAFTMVAQTQSAIPTATPVPPTPTLTDTPISIATFLALPTSEVAATPLPNGNSSNGDPCINQALPTTLQGKTIKIRIDNSTKVALSLTLYLNQTVPQNQCGYRSYTLDPAGSLVINDLVEGCYTLWAWNPDPKNYFIVTNGTNCLDASNSWTFDISTRNINLR